MASVASTDGGAERTVWSSAGDERSFGELLTMLLRRWRLIATIAAMVVIPALLYALLATRYYSASSVVLLEPRSSLSQSDGMRYSFASDSALVDSQMKLITSETVLRRAVDREGLQEDPEFGRPTGGLWWSMKRVLGLVKEDAEQQRENVNATVDALAKAVTVKRPERTYVMEVSVASWDARKAARLANAIAEAYIADQTDARGEVSRREQDYLEGNIAELRRKIEQAEREVENYKAQNQIIGASGKLVNEQLLAEINTELASARARAAEARSRYEQVRQIIASGRSVETLPDALKSPVIDKLRGQFAEIVRQEANAKTTLGELHPQYREIQQQLRDTRRLINEELSRIGEGARNDLRIAEANEASIARQVEELKREATTTNQSSVRLRELEREVETNKAVLDNLLKAKGAVTRDSVDMPIARIIARASPPTAPSSPRRIPIMLLAGFIGVGLGVVAAFAAEGVAISHSRLSVPPDAPWTMLRLGSGDGEVRASDASYGAILRELADAAPARADADRPATALIVDCGAGRPGASLALDLARACVDKGRATLLLELGDPRNAFAHALGRDLPVGVVEIAPGQHVAATLALEDGPHKLAVAFVARRAENDSAGMKSFGKASDFDLVIGYAADAAALRDPDEAVAGAGLVALAVERGAPLAAAQRRRIERIGFAAGGRCMVVAAPALR